MHSSAAVWQVYVRFPRLQFSESAMVLGEQYSQLPHSPSVRQLLPGTHSFLRRSAPLLRQMHGRAFRVSQALVVGVATR